MLTQNLVEINLPKSKRLWRNYPDSFLKELREELVDETHRNKYLQSEFHKNRKIYVHCKSKEGFDRLMKELLLENYLDENGYPLHLFAGIGSMDKELDRETYLKAVDEYLDFCEKEIPQRAERIIYGAQNEAYKGERGRKTPKAVYLQRVARVEAMRSAQNEMFT